MNDSSLGSKIDDFDIVVRFNNFETNGYEKSVGSKTDIWATRICETIKRREEDFKVIGIVNYCIYTKAIESLVPGFMNMYPDCSIVNKLETKGYSQQFGYDKNKNWLTVGLITMMHLLNRKYNHLHICGFSGDTTKHYFKLDPRDPQFHNFEKEREYIKSLKSQGKISILD